MKLNEVGDMPKTRELNDIMEIDHVVRVHPDGTVTGAPGVYAPEVFVFTDADGQVSRQEDADMVARCESQGWEVMDGYSMQSGCGARYSGPVMHTSEYIGGRMEEDIRERPGLYVACVVECLGPDRNASENEEPAGWVLLRKPDPS
jgi:hypothetical protein